MRILVTNDDGINAPGLDVCAEIARALSDDVWVVAPEFDQSGVSHSLSLNDPLRMRAVDERRFAIKGTPTDCVIMGVRHILDGNGPDLILSGVNRGQNAAEDVTYSGTIAGAIEGAILGIPSVALSQAYSAANRQNPFWDTALHARPRPDPQGARRGHSARRAGQRQFPRLRARTRSRASRSPPRASATRNGCASTPRHDGRGNPYYWIAFARGPRPPSRNGTDLRALSDHWISVTPLRIDMTDEPFMTRLAELFG